MRNPQESRRRWWQGPARGLLLALALAACGDDDAETGDPAVQADSAQVEAADASGATCKPPPSPPAQLLTPSTTWAQLQGWLDSAGVTFPDVPANVAVDSVPLCPGCARVRVRLQSTNSTYCLSPDSAGQRRIAGRLTLLQNYPGGGGIDPIPAGQVMYLFSLSTPGKAQPATVVYQSNGNVKLAPSTAWRFYYCQHQPGGTSPQAQWRPEQLPQDSTGQNAAAQGADSAAQLGDDEKSSYAWMACANGCCQFYTPPPMMGDPPGRDTIPPPGGYPPPFWCTGRPNHP